MSDPAVRESGDHSGRTAEASCLSGVADLVIGLGIFGISIALTARFVGWLDRWFKG